MGVERAKLEAVLLLVGALLQEVRDLSDDDLAALFARAADDLEHARAILNGRGLAHEERTLRMQVPHGYRPPVIKPPTREG